MVEKLIRLPQVMEMCGYRKTHIYNEIKRGAFPPYININPRLSVWQLSEVEKFIEDTIRINLDTEAQKRYITARITFLQDQFERLS